MATKQKTNDYSPPRSYDLLTMAFGITNELMEREGVTDDDLEARIQQFLDQADEKLNSHRYMRTLAQTTGRMIRDEANRLVAVARRIEQIADRCDAGARMVLEGRVETEGWEKGRKLESTDGVVYLKRYAALEIDDPKALLSALGNSPHAHKFVKVKPSLDRTAVKQAVKRLAATPDRTKADAEIEKLIADDDGRATARMVERTSVIWQDTKATEDEDDSSE